MSLATLGFKLYEDEDLTVLFSGTLSTVHETDLSDNPQDFVLYYGDPIETPATQLRAVSNPGTDQITLTPTDILPEWTAATAYTLGQAVQPTTPNTFWYEVTTAGTSHASVEPTWPTAGIGSTVVDGTIIWTLKGLKHPTTEIKLALTSGGLAGATGGAALNIGATLLSGASNATEINIRIANSVQTVSNDMNQPHLGLYINAVQQEAV